MTKDSTSKSTKTRWLISPSLIHHQYNSMSGQLKIYNFNTDSFNITTQAYCKASVYPRTIRYSTQTEYQSPSLIFTWPSLSQRHIPFRLSPTPKGVWSIKMTTSPSRVENALTQHSLHACSVVHRQFWLLSVVITANVSNSVDYITTISYELYGHCWMFWWKVYKRSLLYWSLVCLAKGILLVPTVLCLILHRDSASPF